MGVSVGKDERRSTYQRHRSKRPKKFHRYVQKDEVAICQCRSHLGTRKVLYPNRKLAKSTARMYGENYRLYKCPRGEGWHIATINKQRRRSDD